MTWEKKAELGYLLDEENKRRKAIAAGKAMDNALKTEYSTGNERGHGAGVTKSHFMMSNYLKYFSYEALGFDRIKLIWNMKNDTELG